MHKLLKHFAEKIMASREPDVVIGAKYDPPYLKRWWVIPRNRLFNIYLHEMQHDDDDRAMHSHPWINMSYIIEGGYNELTPKGMFPLQQGEIRFRVPSSFHRLEIQDKRTVSLFITGPRVKNWGFSTPWGFVPWEDFVDVSDGGNGKEIGKKIDIMHVEISEARSSIKRLIEEIEKGQCVVRCANCHSIKTWKDKQNAR